MKLLLATVTALLAAVQLVAADPPIPASIPACGQSCIKDLVRQAKSRMGCPDAQASCLCEKPNFQFGIRDCSIQGCGRDVQDKVLDWYYGELCAAPAAQPTSTLQVIATSFQSQTRAAPVTKATPVTFSTAKKPSPSSSSTLVLSSFDEWGPIVTMGPSA
ncbi:hypothetical protein EJ06DRAFT_560297 [Trichodelitschia bisporula]|uniref:CFEM domain-containing protein n=1 Tax=Trichodelitschia bisporula TaxID=703511 RepID=A0A6G1HJM9_9PEZI|nr:hypothetical protein EJ06DRAFT_560297 [Trichodelitschia bisporula]